jgi:hypothetical protein
LPAPRRRKQTGAGEKVRQEIALPRPDYTEAELDAEYAKLNPPRRYYQDYWASPEADKDMKNVPPGMTNFFRGFYYMKSADFPGNQNLPPLHPVWSAPVTGLTRSSRKR